jgi:protein-disulfide isomerase
MRPPLNRLQPPVDASRDHIGGPVDAPITLVEYGDYQCTYCRRVHAGIKRLREERLGDQLRYVFRHLPNARPHPQAWLAAQAAEAAAAQGAFWEMHEYLFAHQAELDRNRLVWAAGELGLDVERFARELDDRAHVGRIEQDFAGGRQSGADSTPTFFINGRRYDGAWDADSVLEAIEEPLGLKIRLLAQEFAGLSASACRSSSPARRSATRQR